MGSMYLRGKTWWVQYYRNGRPYRESSKSAKQKDAERLLRKREGEIAEGRMPGVYFDRVRFEELSADFLRVSRVNGQKSVDRSELSVKHLAEVFGGMRITDITTPRVQAYIENRLGEGASNATINRELSALRRMLNLGAKQTPPKVDRVPHIPMLKENNVRKGFFEHGEFLAVREALPKYLRGFVTFAYRTGWRKAEIVNLQWSQVDRINYIVYLNPGETKNDAGRTVYLDEELKGVIQGAWEARKRSSTLTPYVFPNWYGTARIKKFTGAWKTATEKAGVPGKLFHDLRRSSIRNMVRAGVPERVAMAVSGHKTPSVFQRYNIVSDADLKLAAQRAEAYLREQTATISSTIAKFPPLTKNEGANR